MKGIVAQMNEALYRDMREERGTQAEVAALLGVRQATISDRETGRTAIPKEAFLALLSLPKKSSVKKT